MSTDNAKRSGWETADNIAHGAGKVVDGVGWVMTKIWGLVLVAGAILLMVLKPGETWWLSLIIGAYGIYLLAPGGKFVIW